MRVLSYGPRSALIECPDVSAPALAHALNASGNFIEAIPAERSVLVRSSTPLDPHDLQRFVDALTIDVGAAQSRLIEIPVDYTGEDLPLLAAATGLSVHEIISIHSETTYLAAFAGFAPGYVYCTGLDPRLHIPRRPTPRISVPAGSVAIADVYTAVYPQASPGGWHLLGTTQVQMFDLHAPEPALIRPGDQVRFTVRNP